MGSKRFWRTNDGRRESGSFLPSASSMEHPQKAPLYRKATWIGWELEEVDADIADLDHKGFEGDSDFDKWYPQKNHGN